MHDSSAGRVCPIGSGLWGGQYTAPARPGVSASSARKVKQRVIPLCVCTLIGRDENFRDNKPRERERKRAYKGPYRAMACNFHVLMTLFCQRALYSALRKTARELINLASQAETVQENFDDIYI